MGDIIKIPASHSKYLVQAYRDAYFAYMEKKQALSIEWAEMEPILKELKILDPAYEFMQDDEKAIDKLREVIRDQDRKIKYLFDSLSWFEKVQFILKEVKQPLTVNEIAEYISEFDYDKDIVTKSISPILTTAFQNKKIDRGEEKKNGELTYKLKKDIEELRELINAVRIGMVEIVDKEDSAKDKLNKKPLF